MYSVERKSEIINMLENQGSVDVNDLSEKFGVSRETIRRDLREMESDNVLQRTHGGAVLSSSVNSNEFPVVVRGIQRFPEKNAICKKAVSFIRDGDTIFVDNSSTTLYLIKYIPQNIRVTIITNSIQFLLESTNIPNQGHLLISLGGIFKGSNLSVYGNQTLRNAEEYYPNKAFMSCASINPQTMVTDSSIHEIDTKRMMVSRAQQVFLLADHSKFEKSGQVFLAKLSSINYIITDKKAKTTSLEYLKSEGVHLVVADD